MDPVDVSSAASKTSFSARTECDSHENDVISRKKFKTSSSPDTSCTPSGLSINPTYTSAVFKTAVNSLLKAWKEGGAPSSAVDVQPALSYVFRKPFPHLICPDFFDGPIEGVEDDLLAQKFNALSTDLLQLSQTRELSHVKVKEFANLTATFQNDIRPWVETITNIELVPTVDIRGAKYGYTDHLVCHDDRLASRKVAYVYYLTPPNWTAEDGGTLDLFDSICLNDTVIPGQKEKSIIPLRNSLVLFVVGDESFHQVSEVLSTRKIRLSLTGWFHAKSATPPRIEYQEHTDIEHHEIFEADKVDMEICHLAKEDDQVSFSRKSILGKEMKEYHACTVRNLVQDAFYKNVVAELRLRDKNLPWAIPSNLNQSGLYKYVELNSYKLSKDMPTFSHLLRIFLTDRFLNSLHEISGLQITTLSEHQLRKTLTQAAKKKDTDLANGSGSSNDRAKDNSSDRWLVELAQFRLERFEAGNYTLKTFEAVQMDDVIDIFYFMDCDLLDSDCGGSVVMVDINEPTDDWDPIVAADGESNGLLILRREKDSVFFTEYINQRWLRRNGGRPFYRVWMSFPAEEIVVPTGVGNLEEQNSGSEGDESDDSDQDGVQAALSTSEDDDDDEDDEDDDDVE